MFRRKEEGLFDAATDQNQMHDESEQAEGVTQPASASFGTSSSSGSANSAANTTATTPATSTAAPIHQSATPVAPRPNPAPPTANSFRPTASGMTSDLSRNRMPEAKPQQPVATTGAGTATAAASVGEKTKGGKRVLTVGNDILLKGEIATCDRLVIEGKVDATLNDVHTVEIAECGSFKGSAQIEDAEISGLFEGDLTVRGRLVIYATGKVRGKISYGEIEIERGGELTGEIKIAGANAASSRPASRNSQKEDKVAA